MTSYFSENLYLFGVICLNHISFCDIVVLHYNLLHLSFWDEHMYHDYFQVTNREPCQDTLTFSLINIMSVAN